MLLSLLILLPISMGLAGFRFNKYNVIVGGKASGGKRSGKRPKESLFVMTSKALLFWVALQVLVYFLLGI